MKACLIYKQTCKLTSFVVYLRLRSFKHLRKYPCVDVGQNLETLHSENTFSMETILVKYVSLVM